MGGGEDSDVFRIKFVKLENGNFYVIYQSFVFVLVVKKFRVKIIVGLLCFILLRQLEVFIYFFLNRLFCFIFNDFIVF